MIGLTAAYARGKSHIRAGKNNQDAYCIMPLNDNMWICAVADGVGSCKHAEIASSIAVETVCHFIYDNFPIDHSPVSVKSMLRTALNKAIKEIYKEAEKNQDSMMAEYQTTLMVLIYDGRRGYCSHVGDGGIFGLTKDGTFAPLTTRQQTDDGYVIPLSAGYQFWEIFELTEDYAGIIMATDGVADKLRNPSVDNGIYVPLMLLFDPHVIRYLEHANVNYSRLFADPKSIPRQIIYNAIYRALRKDYGFKKATAMNIVSSIRKGALFRVIESIEDDITAVCCYNTEIHPHTREPKYYLEPDWASIFSKQRKLLYPDIDSGTGDKLSVEDVAVTNTPQNRINKPIRKIKLAFGKLIKNVKRDA